MVSIPRVCHINTGHTFGSKVIGAFVIEGDGGTRLNDAIFNSNTAESREYANQLVKICKHYKFDGYLINIESKYIQIY